MIRLFVYSLFLSNLVLLSDVGERPIYQGPSNVLLACYVVYRLHHGQTPQLFVLIRRDNVTVLQHCCGGRKEYLLRAYTSFHFTFLWSGVFPRNKTGNGISSYMGVEAGASKC